MSYTISVLCYGHTFQIQRIPTESTEMAYRRLWWMVREWFQNKNQAFDELWIQSFRQSINDVDKKNA
jgi:hypothetical protein